MQKSNHSSSPMQYREALRFRILRTALALFKRRGVKAVRMDDIASALTISKRTLYEVYAKKETLLLECIRYDKEEMQKRLQDYSISAENELDIVVTFFRMKFSDLDTISPLFLTEIEQYPEVSRFLRLEKEEHQRQSGGFIRTCIEKGFFVPDINYHVIEELSELVMGQVISKKLYERFSLRDIFFNFFIVLLRGFCTEKGLTLLDSYLKRSKNG